MIIKIRSHTKTARQSELLFSVLFVLQATGRSYSEAVLQCNGLTV